MTEQESNQTPLLTLLELTRYVPYPLPFQQDWGAWSQLSKWKSRSPCPTVCQDGRVTQIDRLMSPNAMNFPLSHTAFPRGI